MMIGNLGRGQPRTPEALKGNRNSVRNWAVEADLTADGSRPAGPLSGGRGKGYTNRPHSLLVNAGRARGPVQRISPL
jgi:hypothetical protein